MNINSLKELKKRLVALSLIGTTLVATGCKDKDINAESDVPKLDDISYVDTSIEDYYKFIIKDGMPLQVYDTKYVLLLYSKDDYEVSEYISFNKEILGGLGTVVELYDLPTEQLIAYCDGIKHPLNEEYFYYLRDNFYQVCLSNAGDYIEGYTVKDYYSLDEIRELEPKIEEGLKLVNSKKNK